MHNIFEFMLKRLLLLALIVGLSVISLGQTTYVDQANNKCDLANGAKNQPYRTFSEGVNKTPEGGKVDTYAGVYNEQLTISKPLTLTSSGGSARIGLNSTRKICQLSGDIDLEPCATKTRSQTNTRFKLEGTDLGFPIEHNNRIYFLFGDSIPTGGDVGHTPDRPREGDAVAWIDANANPDLCFNLNFITAPDGGYLSPKVVPQSPDPNFKFSLGRLEVPSSGFSAKGKIYAFFTTEYVKIGVYDVMRRSALTRLDDENRNLFTHLYDVSDIDPYPCAQFLCVNKSGGKFINISPVVVNNADVPGLPQTTGQGVLMWGSGLYHHSNPSLAYVPLDSIEEKSAWLYAKLDANGNLEGWSDKEADATPLFNHPCLGELSVTWNSYLNKWLMLYNCGGPDGIQYRVADTPWGKWEERGLLFDPAADGGYCHFIYEPGCDPDGKKGAAYGPYVIPSFTKGDATTTTVYWVLSTWDPYQTVLMRSTLRRSDGRRVN
jgi:Domain of unknown function (DUF4185)